MQRLRKNERWLPIQEGEKTSSAPKMPDVLKNLARNDHQTPNTHLEGVRKYRMVIDTPP